MKSKITSWDIVKENFITYSKPGTLARHVELINSADLFIKLAGFLSDRDESMAAFNADHELKAAFSKLGAIRELRKDGVIR